jgi:tRNA(Leu) C34 or U34 (ribose-2'-O)-methylase TrmL
MDYAEISKILRYQNFKSFRKKNSKSRIVLMTTKAKKSYHMFKFKKKIFCFLEEKALEYPMKYIDKLKIK